MLPELFRLPAGLPILGGLPITSFGVMMLLAFLVGGIVLQRELGRQGLDAEKAWDIVVVGIIGGLVGARLYYVFLNYPAFAADPFGMLFARAGMVWYGGFLLATVLIVRKVRKSGMPLGRTADAVAPALALAYAVGRIGCFLVGDDYGRPTDSWVGISFPRGIPPTTPAAMSERFGIAIDPAMIEKYGEFLPVHPTQLYEVGMSILIFFVLRFLARDRRAAGWLFMAWLAMAGVERFVVEIFRAKDDRFFGALTLAQVISLGLVAVGVFWMSRLSKGKGPAGRRRKSAG
ncbi:MAG: prolipoprotein diacylglyceryl transferase [Gemmatimonadetes bacterium]|nr:prolipoprotein diacylglyceryl transferase [Gemmatimonadota bacterium]MYI06136.1 prolipoprotein diacylglyceryl transferase [Gemmatimonadota bacterium]